MKHSATLIINHEMFRLENYMGHLSTQWYPYLVGNQSILIAIYYMLKNNEYFHDLSFDYYNQFNTDKKIKSYLKMLE